MTKKKPTAEQYLQNILIEKEAVVSELRAHLASVHEQLEAATKRAAQWERRFDRLLNVMSGDVNNNDTKWRDVIQKLHQWAVPQRDGSATHSYNRQT